LELTGGKDRLCALVSLVGNLRGRVLLVRAVPARSRIVGTGGEWLRAVVSGRVDAVLSSVLMGDSRLSLVSVDRTDLGVTSVRVAWGRNAVIGGGSDI